MKFRVNKQPLIKRGIKGVVGIVLKQEELNIKIYFSPFMIVN